MKDTCVCNRCGRELDLFDRQQDFTIHKRIGYGSIHDGDMVTLRLCSRCFDDLVGACAIWPIRECAEE